MKSCKRLRKEPWPVPEEEETYARVQVPTSTSTACPGTSSNTDGVIPKGGCSTKPVVATALKRSSRLHNSVVGNVTPSAQTTHVSPPNVRFAM